MQSWVAGNSNDFWREEGWARSSWPSREPRRGALKVLHPELTQRPGFDTLFKQEMRTLMKLDAHPNLVSIIDFDRDVKTGSQYFVMEFVEGISLEQYVNRKGAMMEDIACRIFLGVADALAKAHAARCFPPRHQACQHHAATKWSRGVDRLGVGRIGRRIRSHPGSWLHSGFCSS